MYILGLPSFIMAMNDFEAQKSTSILDKSITYGSRGLIKAF